MADVKYTIEVDAVNSAREVNKLDETVKSLDKQFEQISDTTQSTGLKFTELNSILSLVQTGAQVFGAAMSSAIEGLNRGADVNDVAGAFQNLAKRAGAVSDVLIGDLRKAAGGTINDFQLMQNANTLLNAGLDPSVYDEVIQAARAYADQVGGDSKDAVDQLVEAIKRGDDRVLKQQQIFVDNRSELEKYALSIGKTVEDIDELTQKEVIRGAITEAIIERNKQLGDVENDVADNTKAVGEAITNLVDDFLKTIATNESLNQSFADLAKVLQDPDTRKAAIDLANALSAIVTAAIKLGDIALPKMITALNFVAKPLKDTFELASRIAGVFGEKVSPALEEGREFLYDYNTGLIDSKKQTEGLIKPNKDHATQVGKIHEQYEALAKSLKDTQKEQKSETDLILETERELQKLGRAQQDGTINAGEYARAVDALAGAFKEAGGDLSRFGELSQKVSLDLKDAIKGPKSFGDSFLENLLNIDLSEDALKSFNLTDQLGQQIGSLFRDTAVALDDGKIAEAEARQLGAAIGGVIGTAIGAYFGGGAGAAAGGAIGSTIGSFIGGLFKGGDSGFEKARKAVDKYFLEIFEANRLTVVVGGELLKIKDLITKVFSDDPTQQINIGATSAATIGAAFEQLPNIVQQAFIGVGDAFAQLIGVAEEFGAQVSQILAANLGGSINNLQLLIEATGLSAEQLKTALIESFEAGNISASEALTALQGIQRTTEKGIPDGIGLVVEAFDNLAAAGTAGGRASVDAIRDIASEAKELFGEGATLDQIRQELLKTGKFTAEEIDRFFQLLAENGIDSVDELENASIEAIIAILAKLEEEGKILQETGEKVKETAEIIEKIPDKTEKEVVFKVRVEFDEAAQSSAGQSAIATAGGDNNVSIPRSFQQTLGGNGN